MATAGGTPPTGATPKPKREITPEQKRTFAGLGVVGVLALIVGVMYLPGLLGGGGSGTTVPVAPTSGAVTNSATGPSSGASPVSTRGPSAGLPVSPVGGTAGGIVASTSPAGVQVQPIVFVSKARTDPFTPVYLISAPLPVPTPTPPDPQILIPSPLNFRGNTPRTQLDAEVAAPLNIGSPDIPSLGTITAPRDAYPLPRTSGETTGGAPQQSYDKRLAGVIIGDGVSALLELPSGSQRVVRPGDEVEGVRVLTIERFRQGDRTITRMLVRDTDGTQKYVELKPSAQPQTGAGEGGGLGIPGAPVPSR